MAKKHRRRALVRWTPSRFAWRLEALGDSEGSRTIRPCDLLGDAQARDSDEVWLSDGGAFESVTRLTFD